MKRSARRRVSPGEQSPGRTLGPGYPGCRRTPALRNSACTRGYSSLGNTARRYGPARAQPGAASSALSTTGFESGFPSRVERRSAAQPRIAPARMKAGMASEGGTARGTSPAKQAGAGAPPTLTGSRGRSARRPPAGGRNGLQNPAETLPSDSPSSAGSRGAAGRPPRQRHTASRARSGEA